MRNLNIIIEGIDNVGKSTLITHLKNSLNNYTLHVLHYSNVKQNTIKETVDYNKKLYTEMFEMMINNIKNDKSGFIFDRSHLGELVYGPMYRDYTGDYVIDIEKKYHNILDLYDSLFLIVLIDEPENVIARDDGLSFTTDVDKKRDEINLFELAFQSSTIKNKILINIKDKDEYKVLEEVKEFITSVGAK